MCRSGEAEYDVAPTNGWNGIQEHPDRGAAAAAASPVLQRGRENSWAAARYTQVILLQVTVFSDYNLNQSLTIIIPGFCRFVRRQKEIALAQCEASKGEALRYRERMGQQNREIKELQEALNAEKMKMQVWHFFILYFIVLYFFDVYILTCTWKETSS